MRLIAPMVIEKIYYHHLSKKRRFHPALIQRLGLNFCEEHINSRNTNLETQKDLQILNDFAINNSITSTKTIVKLCQLLNPNYITGFYDAKYHIEVFAYHRRNLYMCQHIIELEKTHYFSKKELYQLYSFSS